MRHRQMHATLRSSHQTQQQHTRKEARSAFRHRQTTHATLLRISMNVLEAWNACFPDIGRHRHYATHRVRCCIVSGSGASTIS